jgi:hypothetical protein
MHIGKLSRKIYRNLRRNLRKFWIVTVTMVARKDTFNDLCAFRVTGVDMPMMLDVQVPFRSHQRTRYAVSHCTYLLRGR